MLLYPLPPCGGGLGWRGEKLVLPRDWVDPRFVARFPPLAKGGWRLTPRTSWLAFPSFAAGPITRGGVRAPRKTLCLTVPGSPPLSPLRKGGKLFGSLGA